VEWAPGGGRVIDREGILKGYVVVVVLDKVTKGQQPKCVSALINI
jgi:hypothetical protein